MIKMKILVKSNTPISQKKEEIKRDSRHFYLFLFIYICIGITIWFTVFPKIYFYAKSRNYQKIAGALRSEILKDGRIPDKSMLSFTTKFYFFHITNPNEIQIGNKPILKEVGPYFYEEHHSKIIEYEGEGILKYRPKISYVFHPEVSYGSERDQITLLNVPFISVLKILSDLTQNTTIISELEKHLSSLGESLFRTASIKEWLFDGIPNSNYQTLQFPPIEALKHKIPRQLLDEKFGFLYKINLRDNIWVVSTENQNLGDVLRWNNNTKLNAWNDKKCNEILGTDGTLFSAGVTEKSFLYLFSPEICQSLKLKFIKTIHDGNSTVLVFDFDPAIWNHSSQNTCHCKNCQHCTGNGVLPMDNCWGGSPMTLSLPHFKNASPEFLSGVDGINPSKKEADYNTYFYFENNDDRYGRFIGRKIRLQLNINLRQYPSTTTFSLLQNTMAPLFWIEQVETVDARMLSLFDLSLYYFAILIFYLLYFMLVVEFHTKILPGVNCSTKSIKNLLSIKRNSF